MLPRHSNHPLWKGSPSPLQGARDFYFVQSSSTAPTAAKALLLALPSLLPPSLPFLGFLFGDKPLTEQSLKPKPSCGLPYGQAPSPSEIFVHKKPHFAGNTEGDDVSEQLALTPSAFYPPSPLLPLHRFHLKANYTTLADTGNISGGHKILTCGVKIFGIFLPEYGISPLRQGFRVKAD